MTTLMPPLVLLRRDTHCLKIKTGFNPVFIFSNSECPYDSHRWGFVTFANRLYFETKNKFLEVKNINNNYNNTKVDYDPEELLKDIMKGLPKVLLHLTTNENLLKQLEDID